MNCVENLKIRVNGKDIDFSGSSVQDLIKRYNLKRDRIVVEKNGEIVHREDYGSEKLREGDVIELVRFVGGG